MQMHVHTLTNFLLLPASVHIARVTLYGKGWGLAAHRTNQMRERTHSTQAMGGPLPPTPGAARENGIRPRDYLKIISGRKD